jgi:YVTN family beta-propeller protein
MKQLAFIILTAVIVYSCTKREDPLIQNPEESIFAGDGAFIINEGNFTWGNGSISFYSYDSSKIVNNIFQKVNNRPLGDVPNSMAICGDYAYIVVNNSGKIEVVKKNSLKSVTTITGLKSPRNITVIDNSKAYVSSLYSDSLIILDLKNNKVSGYINIRRTSEAIVLTGKKAFVSYWYGGNEVVVLDTDLDKVIDSITVGREPESMVIDKKSTLWVLCSGTWERIYYAELVGINAQTHEIVKQLYFPSLNDFPTCLNINGSGDTLYFLENGVKRMDIDESEIPSLSFIDANNHNFYKLGINPLNGDVFVTDAVDYQQNGLIFIYNREGDEIASYNAGIIPGSIYFKVQPEQVTE